MSTASVNIYADNCCISLNLPSFFEQSTLAKIRRAFGLVFEEEWRNIGAIEYLKRFLFEWEKSLKKRLEDCEADEQALIHTVTKSKRQIACFGTMATKEMKDDLKTEQGKLQKAARSVKRTKADIERCIKITNIYDQTVKN